MYQVIKNNTAEKSTKIEAAVDDQYRKSTKIEAALASKEMQNSLALERLIQIVQVLHLYRIKTSSISIEVNNEENMSEAIAAMTIAGMEK